MTTQGSTELVPFESPTGGRLRVIMRDGEPWLVVADVAAALGATGTGDLTRLLRDWERGYHEVHTPGGLQKLVIVSEPGFYRLIMRSNRPEAEAFQRWVTHDVLPAIRKTGRYGQELSRKEVLRMALEAEEAREAAAALVAETRRELEHARPAVEAFEELMDAAGTYSLAEAAQALRIGRQRLIAFAAERVILMLRPGHSDHLRPYQKHVTAGRFTVRVSTYEVVNAEGFTEKRTSATTRVTPKGLEYLRRELRDHGTAFERAYHRDKGE